MGDISELDAEMILVMCSDGSRAKPSRLVFSVRDL